eukprot:scaffold7228_cov523-Prasinococcus_capsulatus_cf.AAC.4
MVRGHAHAGGVARELATGTPGPGGGSEALSLMPSLGGRPKRALEDARQLREEGDGLSGGGGGRDQSAARKTVWIRGAAPAAGVTTERARALASGAGASGGGGPRGGPGKSAACRAGTGPRAVRLPRCSHPSGPRRGPPRAGWLAGPRARHVRARRGLCCMRRPRLLGLPSDRTCT